MLVIMASSVIILIIMSVVVYRAFKSKDYTLIIIIASYLLIAFICMIGTYYELIHLIKLVG